MKYDINLRFGLIYQWWKDISRYELDIRLTKKQLKIIKWINTQNKIFINHNKLKYRKCILKCCDYIERYYIL